MPVAQVNMHIGGEFHYPFKCSHLNPERLIYIKPYFVRQSPSCFKFDNLMNTTDNTITTNLCKFLKKNITMFPLNVCPVA